MAARKRNTSGRRSGRNPREGDRAAAAPRIIGGRFGGRKLLYSGDLRTRPMKDRVREAIFNLVGPPIRGKHAVDLFAGTGAVGLEALSRGAARATFVEQHYPTAAVLRQNVASLGAEDLCEVVTANTFLWARRHAALGPSPWTVFCSPPYDFYVDRLEEVLALVGGLVASSPGQSVFVVEADKRFDFGLLVDAGAWDVRPYAPAVVGIYRKPLDLRVSNHGLHG